MSQTAENDTPPLSLPIPLLLLALGIFLIAASFFPIGKFAARSSWTPEDSAVFDQVTQQYKRSTYQPDARKGLSEEEWKTQREKMKLKIEAMQKKLADARQQPQLWSHYLLWTGASLTASGALLHFAQHGKNS